MPIGLYKCFEDGLAEWIVAHNKVEALNFLDLLWGGLAKEEYFSQYKQKNPLASYEKFAEDFFQEEPFEKELTVVKNDGRIVTMTVREWLDQTKKTPSYFSYQYQYYYYGDEKNDNKKANNF